MLDKLKSYLSLVWSTNMNSREETGRNTIPIQPYINAPTRLTLKNNIIQIFSISMQNKKYVGLLKEIFMSTVFKCVP